MFSSCKAASPPSLFKTARRSCIAIKCRASITGLFRITAASMCSGVYKVPRAVRWWSGMFSCRTLRHTSSFFVKLWAWNLYAPFPSSCVINSCRAFIAASWTLYKCPHAVNPASSHVNCPVATRSTGGTGPLLARSIAAWSSASQLGSTLRYAPTEFLPIKLCSTSRSSTIREERISVSISSCSSSYPRSCTASCSSRQASFPDTESFNLPSLTPS